MPDAGGRHRHARIRSQGREPAGILRGGLIRRQGRSLDRHVRDARHQRGRRRLSRVSGRKLRSGRCRTIGGSPRGGSSSGPARRSRSGRPTGSRRRRGSSSRSTGPMSPMKGLSEFPALLTHRYGQGKVVYFPEAMGAFIGESSMPSAEMRVGQAIGQLLADPNMTVDAPRTVAVDVLSPQGDEPDRRPPGQQHDRRPPGRRVPPGLRRRFQDPDGRRTEKNVGAAGEREDRCQLPRRLDRGPDSEIIDLRGRGHRSRPEELKSKRGGRSPFSGRSTGWRRLRGLKYDQRAGCPCWAGGFTR